jgi:hypothetical protein
MPRGSDASRLPARSTRVERLAERASPSIRIHIGRVDVRAVTPPAEAPPARRERAERLMTLDEYRKQRGGGE